MSELTPEIRRWIYLGTVFAPTAIPLISYALIISGAFIIIFIFIRAYQNFVFATDPSIEILEMGRRSIRRGSSILIHNQHRLLNPRDSYTLLKVNSFYNQQHNHHLITNKLLIINNNNNTILDNNNTINDDDEDTTNCCWIKCPVIWCYDARM